MGRMDELFYELYASSKRHNSWQRQAMIRELRNLLNQPKESGSDHFERSGEDRRFGGDDRRFGVGQFGEGADDDEEQYLVMDEELAETEVATELNGIEDRTVENEANSKVISVIVKEESIPQILMVTEADSTCVQQHVSISPLEHSLNFCKANLDDDACQVFDVIPMRTKVLPKEHKERLKPKTKRKLSLSLKTWMFKFKSTSKRRKSLDVKSFSVEEIAWLMRDSKEIYRSCVDKEFKAVMAACRETRVDQFKLVEEKESKPEVLNLKPTCLYHQIGHGEKERLGIKKKRKGFKSWMFKYKRGDKKLHTLIFSNNMRMVVFQQRGLLVYLQMRKAETSSDLLMFNGKYSLPRRAIGSKLDTGEIVLSNQERNELCTENKEEVKSCLDRPQASVLMEEEPDSVRVNGVKLENKQTWTKLKVKKHDNLSWKEDESGSICCILKLGGVAITCKNVLEKIYAENLEIMACRLRPAMMESSVPSKVIGRDGSKRDISTVAKTQGLGFVHVLHKDAVLDSKLGYLIGNMREEDQKRQGDSELLVIVLECDDAKGGVGMDKKPFHLSLRNHEFGIREVAFQDFLVTVKAKLALLEEVQAPLEEVSSFSNLEVKVSSKEGDLI